MGCAGSKTESGGGDGLSSESIDLNIGKAKRKSMTQRRAAVRCVIGVAFSLRCPQYRKPPT